MASSACTGNDKENKPFMANRLALLKVIHAMQRLVFACENAPKGFALGAGQGMQQNRPHAAWRERLCNQGRNVLARRLPPVRLAFLAAQEKYIRLVGDSCRVPKKRNFLFFSQQGFALPLEK
ncbi:MAG: hypothetical protein IJ392_01585 [Clostridia bacterium]|nr:hypothetical protein [Clostridia bacterium]